MLAATDRGPGPTVQWMDRAFAAAYARFAPAVERGRIGDLRRELLDGVTGHLVDVGAGIGANLPHLDTGVEHVTLLEPSPHMARRLREVIEGGPDLPPTTVLEASGEAIPLPDASADAVLCTLVLCTVQDQPRTLHEVRRVLRPDGRLVLLEHVHSDGALGRFQRAVRPVWRFLGRGCDPTRDTRRVVRDAGFDVTDVQRWRLPELGLVPTVVTGVARRDQPAPPSSR